MNFSYPAVQRRRAPSSREAAGVNESIPLPPPSTRLTVIILISFPYSKGTYQVMNGSSRADLIMNIINDRWKPPHGGVGEV